MPGSAAKILLMSMASSPSGAASSTSSPRWRTNLSVSSSSATRSSRCVPTIPRRSGRSRPWTSFPSSRSSDVLGDNREGSLFSYLSRVSTFESSFPSPKKPRRRWSICIHRCARATRLRRERRSDAGEEEWIDDEGWDDEVTDGEEPASPRKASPKVRTSNGRKVLTAPSAVPDAEAAPRRRPAAPRHGPHASCQANSVPHRSCFSTSTKPRAVYVRRPRSSSLAWTRPHRPPMRRLRSRTSGASQASSSTAAFPTGLPRSSVCATTARSMLFVAATQRPRRADDRAAQGIRRSFAVPVERADDARYAAVLVATGNLSRGFRLPDAGLQLYAEADVFEEERRAPERRRSASKAFLSDLRDLKVGDLVVHVDHGIGAFVGLKQIGVGDTSSRSSSSSATPARTSCSCRSSASTWSRSTPARRGRRSIGSAARRGNARRHASRRPCATWPRSC